MRLVRGTTEQGRSIQYGNGYLAKGRRHGLTCSVWFEHAQQPINSQTMLQYTNNYDATDIQCTAPSKM